MSRYLIDHAVQNVWCNPDQDNQLLIAAKRITKQPGELNRFQLMNRTIQLPSTGKRYHVFQIGQIHPALVGLLPKRPSWAYESWISFSDAVNNLKLFMSLYTNYGLYLPRFKSYYMYSNERDLIFAVEVDANFNIDYDTDVIYLRLYTNAYYQSLRADAVEDYLYCTGKTIQNSQDIVDIQETYNSYKAKLGYTTAYVNGYIVKSIDSFTTKLGDSVEFIYDSSVKRVVTFKVADLPVFTSELDSKYKYLLHHLDTVNDTIDYQDDIDIDVIRIDANGRYQGRYYCRNSQDSHRMVTHRDYSVPVDYINFIGTKLINDLNVSGMDLLELRLEVKIRNSGYHRPLIYDHNRIFELYKLDNAKILQAMTGLDANVDIWKASALENSAYARLMRVNSSDVTLGLVQSAYGYNSISKLVGDTPTKTTLRSNRQAIDVSDGLYENSTAYEYDQNGNFLGSHYHQQGTQYLATNDNTRLVEMISGRGTYQPDVRFGIDNILLPLNDNYRVYMCYIVDGFPNNDWRDITGSNLYHVENNTLIWGDVETGQFLMVRTDTTFLAYDFELEMTGGAFYFTLSEQEDRGDGVKDYALPVPLGELDIYLNGKSLINGLDYIIQFPKVFIVNKSFLAQPADTITQQLHIRFTGFCNSDLTMDAIDDFGFIQHGLLSNNNKFDIRDDKVLRITANGQLKDKADIVFSELHDGISVTNAANGQPYQIKDIVVPLKGLVDENTYSLRAKSIVIDKAISDYMSIKLPEPVRNAPSSIPQKYTLISPFLSRIIYALKNNGITIEQINAELTDNEIINICTLYEALLPFDPISESYPVDYRYVDVHPHSLNTTINLNLYQYRFLMRVAKLYTNGHIELSPFVTFSI